MRKIFIASDHAGFNLKRFIKIYLNKKKIKHFDLGPKLNCKVDYPDYAHKVAKKVKSSKSNIGILICGSGTGMNIAANKHKNIRAAQCFNLKVFFWVLNLKVVDTKKEWKRFNICQVKTII